MVLSRRHAPTSREKRRQRAGATFLGQAVRLALVPLWVLVLSIAAHQAHARPRLTLVVPGASEALLADLRASSTLFEAHALGRTDPADLMAAARLDYTRLLGILYEAGHYAPIIRVRIDGQEAAELSTLRPPERIERIEIAIELGPEFRFGRTEIGPLAEGTELPENFVPGAVARSTVIRQAATAALARWRAEGHALATIARQDVIADHQRQRLDVTLRLRLGPRLAFGELHVVGAERTIPARIRRIAGLTKGGIYDPDQISTAESRLRRTGAFSSVALRTAERANPDGTIDVIALIEEAPLRRFGFGVEIDSDTGLGLSGFWLHRNLRGRADRLHLSAQLAGLAAREGGIDFGLDGRYTIPAVRGPDTDGTVGLRALRVDERDYRADRLAAEVLFERRISERLATTLAFVLRGERASFGPSLREVRTFGTFALEGTLTVDTRDRTLDPSEGHFLSITLSPYLGFGAARAGMRLAFDGRQYVWLPAFSAGGFVLAGRVQLGAVFGPAIAATPREFLFYSGGGGSVRGMPYQSLGVVVDGIASGGRGFAAASAEARLRLTGPWQAVAFIDAGRVSAGAFSRPADWHAGAGFGVRYDTPIGPLRFDLATPLRRNASATGVRRLSLYIGLGQAF